MSNSHYYIIHTDGASRGNPGPAAIGVTITDENGRQVAAISRRLPDTTNNKAEYQAVIAGLEKALELGARDVLLYTDSELVARQISGVYRVRKASLLPLYNRVLSLIAKLDSFAVQEISRNFNFEADTLAKRAFKRQP